jgi:hypothetical protein
MMPARKEKSETPERIFAWGGRAVGFFCAVRACFGRPREGKLPEEVGLGLNLEL